MSNILEIYGLYKNYGKKTALKNIDFCIPNGRIVGLLGPNGSGKTTIIKIITGLLSQYKGQVSIDGNLPSYLSNSHISYLPDKTHIPTWLTVAGAINFFSDFYKDFNKDRAEEMLISMNVPQDVKIKTLSRGQQEKVQLSLIMSRKAKLYILDEPIGAVDPASRDFIIDTILKNFDGESSSILLSTHIISDIEPILDEVIFLKEGEIFLKGDVDTLREQNQKSLDELFREVFKSVI